MDAPQLELFEVSPEARLGRVVRTVTTELGPFGNRVDVIIVRGDTVGGASHLECDDPNVDYFNKWSQSPKESL